MLSSTKSNHHIIFHQIKQSYRRRGEFPVISVEAAKAAIKALSEQSVATDPGLLPGKALLRRAAVKYPHGAVSLARGVDKAIAHTAPRV